MKRCCIIALWLFCVSLACADFPPTVAEYELHWGGGKVADVTVELKRRADTMHGRVVSKPTGFLSIFMAPITIDDRFHMSGLAIQPILVERKRDNEKVYERYQFNRQSVSVLRKGKTFDLEVPAHTLTNFTSVLHLMNLLRHNMQLKDFSIVTSGKLRDHRPINRGHTVLKTALGEMGACQIDVSRDEKLRYRYWLSPLHHYWPLKVERLNKSEEVIAQVFVRQINASQNCANCLPPSCRL